MPDNRSFLEIVNGARATSPATPAFVRSADRQLVARLRAFAFSRPWVVTLCVALVGLCAAIYGAIGSIEEQSAASVERKPAFRAARATTAPQQIVEPSRETMPVPATSNGASVNATPPVAAPDGDRIASLIVALGPVDARLPNARLPDLPAANAAPLSLSDSAARADAYVARLWGRIGARDAEAQFDRLAADYADLVSERDQLRERVKELEQTLSSLQLPPGSPQAARMPVDGAIGAASARAGAAVIAFPGTASAGASAGPSAEQPRPVVKNFTTPGSAPNYFTDESGAVLGNPAATPTR